MIVGQLRLACRRLRAVATATSSRLGDSLRLLPMLSARSSSDRSELDLAAHIGASRRSLSPKQDIMTVMPSTDTESAVQDAVAASAGETLSRFITRILDQLSLSSWLPAIVLVCNLAMLFQLHAQHNLDVGTATIDLTDKPVGILIVLTLLIIVASIVTQAFEFEVIRILEGYWGSPKVLRWLAKSRIRRHRKRLALLEQRYKDCSSLAFQEAKQSLRQSRTPKDLIVILEKMIAGKPLRRYDPARIAAAEQIDWRQHAPPEFLRPIDATEALILQYPDPFRIMPTKLGNTLRSGEDRLHITANEDLESYVYRRYARMAVDLRGEHDRYRSQLNIYCLLTFIFITLAIVAVNLLPHALRYFVPEVIFVAIYLCLSFVSYQAAIASARGYVTVLTSIDST